MNEYFDYHNDLYKKQIQDVMDSELEFITTYVPQFADYETALVMAEMMDALAADELLESLMEGGVI